jgi:hypothetical protein
MSAIRGRSTPIYVQAETRSLTLSLPADLIRRAKVYAAERDISLNALVRELLEGIVSGRERIRAAGARILEIAKSGAASTVNPGSFSREDFHER